MPDRPILEIMHAVLSIHPDASVEEAVQKMSSQGMEAILIKQEEEYTGIFTKPAVRCNPKRKNFRPHIDQGPGFMNPGTHLQNRKNPNPSAIPKA